MIEAQEKGTYILPRTDIPTFKCRHDPLGMHPEKECGCKQPREHGHYFRNVEHLTEIDFYRIAELFGIADPCIQHAIKKLLVAGGRGAKDIHKDIKEAIDTLIRWQTMRQEDLKRNY